jgi:hypothetical protein
MTLSRTALDKLVNNRVTDLFVVSLVRTSVALLIAETFLPEHSAAFAALETLRRHCCWRASS